eukprot:3941108-Rhodomonas_salina.1
MKPATSLPTRLLCTMRGPDDTYMPCGAPACTRMRRRHTRCQRRISGPHTPPRYSTSQVRNTLRRIDFLFFCFFSSCSGRIYPSVEAYLKGSDGVCAPIRAQAQSGWRGERGPRERRGGEKGGREGGERCDGWVQRKRVCSRGAAVE